MSLPMIVSAASGMVQGNPLWSNIVLNAQYFANELMPSQRPDLNDLLNKWFMGLCSTNRLKEGALSNSVDLKNIDLSVIHYAASSPEGIAVLSPEWSAKPCSDWNEVVRARAYFPSIQEAGFLYQRKLIDYQLYSHMIRRNVNNNDALTEVWRQANYEIPGPSDLVRFAVREAYNPELITLFGYNKETPTEVLPWMEKQGYGQPAGMDIPPGGTDGNNNARVGKASWFDLYWWSHWELPSLTQGYEMLHRLYPNSRFGPSPDTIGDNTFTPAQLELLQKAQDIPEFWRRKLQAISYHSFTRTDAEYMYENNIIDREGFYHSLRRVGYNDTDTLTLMQMGDLRKMRNLGIAPEKISPNMACDFYKNGLLTKKEVEDILKADGFTLEQAQLFVKKCELELKRETVSDTIKTLEKGFYRGIYNVQDLQQNFQQNGLNVEVMNYYIQRWVYKRTITFKSSSARQNVQSYKLGILNEQALQQRLFNLGYDGTSVSQIMQIAKVELLKTQTVALQKQAKEAAKAILIKQKESLKIAKQQVKDAKDKARVVEKQQKDRIKRFVKGATDANLKAWYKADLITLDEVFYKLYLKGLTIVDANRWIKTNLEPIAKEKLDDAAKKAQEEYTGEGNYLE